MEFGCLVCRCTVQHYGEEKQDENGYFTRVNSPTSLIKINGLEVVTSVTDKTTVNRQQHFSEDFPITKCCKCYGYFHTPCIIQQQGALSLPFKCSKCSDDIGSADYSNFEPRPILVPSLALQYINKETQNSTESIDEDIISTSGDNDLNQFCGTCLQTQLDTTDTWKSKSGVLYHARCAPKVSNEIENVELANSLQKHSRSTSKRYVRTPVHGHDNHNNSEHIQQVDGCVGRIETYDKLVEFAVRLDLTTCSICRGLFCVGGYQDDTTNFGGVSNLQREGRKRRRVNQEWRCLHCMELKPRLRSSRSSDQSPHHTMKHGIDVLKNCDTNSTKYRDSFNKTRSMQNSLLHREHRTQCSACGRSVRKTAFQSSIGRADSTICQACNTLDERVSIAFHPDGKINDDKVIVLLCDGCDREFDMLSLSPPVVKVPEGEWFCKKCQQQKKNGNLQNPQSKQTSTRFNKRKKAKNYINQQDKILTGNLLGNESISHGFKTSNDRNPNNKSMVTLLICHGCDIEIDSLALNPPLTNLPEGDWFCSNCNPTATNQIAFSQLTTVHTQHEGEGVSCLCISCDKPIPNILPNSNEMMLCKLCRTIQLGAGRRKISSIASFSSVKSKKPKRVTHKSRGNPTSPITLNDALMYALPEPYLSLGISIKSTKEETQMRSIDILNPHKAETIDTQEEDDVILVCDLCQGEYGMSDIMDESDAIPARPWYCRGCLKSMKKSRKRRTGKQKYSKQMLWELQTHGSLLRPTAAKNLQQRSGEIGSSFRSKIPVASDLLQAQYELVGRRVVVYCRWDNNWVSGRVSRYDCDSGIHSLLCSDETLLDLPLFTMPYAIGTNILIMVKIPATENRWWPAEIMKMNDLTEHMLTHSTEVQIVAENFYFVMLLGDSLLSPRNGKSDVGSHTCWVPKYLCRAFHNSWIDETAHDELVSCSVARSLKESGEFVWSVTLAFKELLCKVFSMLNDDAWLQFTTEVIGLTLCAKHPTDEKANDLNYSLLITKYDTTKNQFELEDTKNNLRNIYYLDFLKWEARCNLFSAHRQSESKLHHAIIQRLLLHDVADYVSLALKVARYEKNFIYGLKKHENSFNFDKSTNGHHQSTDKENINVEIGTTKLCTVCKLPESVLALGKDISFMHKDYANEMQDSLITCVKCHQAFHDYCADPPYARVYVTDPLKQKENIQEALSTKASPSLEVDPPYLCKNCISCVGCHAPLRESNLHTSCWFQWKFPLSNGVLCQNCFELYQRECYCSVCYEIFDENAFDTSQSSLLMCMTCHLWSHNSCETDPSSVYHPIIPYKANEICKSFKLDTYSARHTDPKTDTESFNCNGTLAFKDDLAAGAQMIADDEFASHLCFNLSNNFSSLSNFECLTCRKLRMLRFIQLLMLEDKMDLFKEPVTADIAPTYLNIIKHPMDLGNMKRKVLTGLYKYASFKDIRDDFELVCLNAVTFNTREREFLIWREAWRFYSQGQKILKQVFSTEKEGIGGKRSKSTLRGGKHYDALVAAAKRQLPNNSQVGKLQRQLMQDDFSDIDADDLVNENSNEAQSNSITTSQAPAEILKIRPDTSNETAPKSTEAQILGKKKPLGFQIAQASVINSSRVDNGNENECEIADSPELTNEHTHQSDPNTNGNLLNSAIDKTSIGLERTTTSVESHTTISIITTAPQSQSENNDQKLLIKFQMSLAAAPAPHSSFSAYTTVLSRPAAHNFCWMDVCFICGSTGTESTLIFCIDCGEGYHSFCIPTCAKRARPKLSNVWRCMNCVICDICGKPKDQKADDLDLLHSCANCDRKFHGNCLTPALMDQSIVEHLQVAHHGIDLEKTTVGLSSSATERLANLVPDLYCSNCVQCQECGCNISTTSYSYHRELCLTCCNIQPSQGVLGQERRRPLIQIWTTEARRQKKDTERCPLCRLNWDPDDQQLIQCDACEQWVHYACDPQLATNRLELMRILGDESSVYVCGACRVHVQQRSHLLSIPKSDRLQLLVNQVQDMRSQCDARWKEVRKDIELNKMWIEWRRFTPVYLYVLRLGEECCKTLAYRSVNFKNDWFTLIKASQEGNDNLILPRVIIDKAARYLRFKRYSRGPRAYARRQERKRENFYSKAGADNAKQPPAAIMTIISEARSCACFLAVANILYGYRNGELSQVVLHLIEGINQSCTDFLSSLRLDKNGNSSLTNGKLKDEVDLILQQYERRVESQKSVIQTLSTPNLVNDVDDVTLGPMIDDTIQSVVAQMIENIVNKHDENNDQIANCEKIDTIKEADLVCSPTSKDGVSLINFTQGKILSGWELPSDSSFVDRSLFEDSRFCELCLLIGDHAICGRLISTDFDQWAHVNCLLWSAEVFEAPQWRDNNLFLLENCSKAIIRSRGNRCDGCGMTGATVGCCVPRCSRNYHFPCAVDHGVQFLEKGETCCPQFKHMEILAKKYASKPSQDASFPVRLGELNEGEESMETKTATSISEDASPKLHEVGSQHKSNAQDFELSTETTNISFEIINAVDIRNDENCESNGGTMDENNQTAELTSKMHDQFQLPTVNPVYDPMRSLRLNSIVSPNVNNSILNSTDVLIPTASPPSQVFSSLTPHESIVPGLLQGSNTNALRVGAVTVHSFGKIVVGNPSFHSTECIFPLGFRSTRIFWSTVKIGQRCLYECLITSNSTIVDDSENLPRKHQTGLDRIECTHAAFQITPSDDQDNPIFGKSADEAILKLRDRLNKFYNESVGRGAHPLESRKSWKSYGLCGKHFFGFGIPQVARQIESLPLAATTAISREICLHNVRKRHDIISLQQRFTQRCWENGSINSSSSDTQTQDFSELYSFAYTLPTLSDWIIAQRAIECVIIQEERLRLSSGCARTDGIDWKPISQKQKKQSLRRLNKEADKEPEIPASEKLTKNSSTPMDIDYLPVAMQYRDLRKRSFDERLEVVKSKIHGYGLFAKEPVVEGQMIVEYQGQMINQLLADEREKLYEDMGIGSCYMFRLDSTTIIDATRVGNLARFINHSCNPRAFARVVAVEGNEKKIVIFAKTNLEVGDEVTYDYKFPIEDEAIQCDCGAPNCIGRMN